MQDAYQEPVDAAPSLLDSRNTSVSDDEPSQINLSPASHLSPSPPDVPCMSSSFAGAKRAAGDDDDSDVRERLLMAKMARMRTSCFFLPRGSRAIPNLLSSINPNISICTSAIETGSPRKALAGALGKQEEIPCLEALLEQQLPTYHL